MDEFSKSCCLEEVAFKWMIHCEFLKSLHEQCERYKKENRDNKAGEKQIYNIIVKIDVGLLLDFDAQLGNIACNQPEKAMEVFQEACFTCIQTLNWIPKMISKTQIDLQTRCSSVPRFISCSSVFALRRELSESGSEYAPLFCTLGLVSGMTSRVNYTRSTWFQCINNACHSTGSGYAGYSTNQSGENLSRDLVCINCGTPLEEDISCRILGEKCLLSIVSPEGLSRNISTDTKCRLNRPISVYVRDELIDEVGLGACYSFTLTPHREFHGGQNSNQLDLFFEANNVTKVNAYAWSPPKVQPKFCVIQRLYEDRKGSPWSFAASLAYFFGDCITPSGTYFRVKLGLLLSLVSQQSLKNDEKLSEGLIHILTVSTDVLPIQRLFLYAKSFAGRSAVFSPCNDLCFSISKDCPNTGSCIIHGGCVLLASGGVCVLSNINELKNDQVEELENVVQTECVNIDVPKKYMGCEQSQISVPVTCKIWACHETTRKQGTRSHYNAYPKECGHLSKTLVDYFSLVFVMTESEGAPLEIFAETLLVHNRLRKTSTTKEESNHIPDDEFFQFLQHAATSEPSFSNEARELIQAFYLASRRTRSSSSVGGEFPIAAFKSMMSLAEGHAKLSLRTEVTEDDAVMAILLYEECMTARVGYSVLGVSPVHHFKDENIMSYIGEQNDEKMTQLKIHIKRFCSLHSNYKYIPGRVTREE